MKNIYSKTQIANRESKNMFSSIISKAKHLLLLLFVPVSVSAQTPDCCVHISTQSDQSNPYLIHFCITQCDNEYQFVSTWDFGDGSPLLFLITDTCVSHLYPAPANKFTVCLSSSMCPGDSDFIGINCLYDTCFTLIISQVPHVGMDESASDFALDVFPNPASDFISVYAESKISSVEILNLLGEKIYSCEATSGYNRIPVNNISSGTYWVKIISANQKPRFRKIQISN